MTTVGIATGAGSVSCTCVIDTPQGRQEAESHPRMAGLVRQTPLGGC